ncbi:YheC/YheD family protein [Paenibacillus sacheonensis]|nr:YheC/YheD family protein [Paenibacillus sacheonensis]
MSRYVGSKWRKTVAIRKNTELASYVPDTLRMTNTTLLQHLNRYAMVYIKPEFGMHGNGVIRVERTAAGYKYQLNKKVRSFGDYAALYRSIRLQTGGKKYLVQKGIRLLAHRGRQFDIRVMAQFGPKRAWETTGIIGRVAAKNKIVTNYHGGGKLLAASRLLGPHTDDVKSKLSALSKLGVRAGKAMQSSFPGVYVIGLDIAMDESLQPWILEVNTRPDPYIFRKHPDPNVFRKIMRYAKAYPKS